MFRYSTLLVLAVLFCSLAPDALSADQPRSQAEPSLGQLSLPGSANELVRQAIQNELKDSSDAGQSFTYRERRQTPSGSRTEQIIETTDGPIGEIIMLNDAPPTADQQKKEKERLEKLATDPDAQQKHRKSQQEDEQRVRKMLAAMPDAFLYQYDGAQQSPAGTLVRLRFEPNPGFKPPDRETQIYRGMRGTMLIEPHDRRLAELNGELFQTVNFGWGIFGHLDPGGHFIVKQSRFSPSRWDTTEMTLKFTGRVLFFKKLNIDEHDTLSDIHPAPRKMTLAQGIQFLETQSEELAQRTGSGKVPASH